MSSNEKKSISRAFSDKVIVSAFEVVFGKKKSPGTQDGFVKKRVAMDIFFYLGLSLKFISNIKGN